MSTWHQFSHMAPIIGMLMPNTVHPTRFHAIHILRFLWFGARWIYLCLSWIFPLRWRHNDHAGVSNHQPHGCLLNRLFRRKSKKTSKLRVTGLCVGNSPGTGEFPAQMASYAENVSIWWRHHALAWWQSHDFPCVIEVTGEGRGKSIIESSKIAYIMKAK